MAAQVIDKKLSPCIYIVFLLSHSILEIRINKTLLNKQNIFSYASLRHKDIIKA